MTENKVDPGKLEAFLAEMRSKRKNKPLSGLEEVALIGLYKQSQEEGISLSEALNRAKAKSISNRAASLKENPSEHYFINSSFQTYIRAYDNLTELIDDSN